MIKLLLIILGIVIIGGLFINETLPETEPIFEDKTTNKMIFVIHGITGTPKPYRILAEHFNEKGYTVYVPLLKNHGKQLSDLKDITMEEIKNDVEQDLIEKKRYYKIYLMGISSGGLIALDLAQKHNLPVIIINAPLEKTNLNFLTVIPYFYRLDYGLWKDPEAGKEHISFSKYPTHFLKEIYEYEIPNVTVPILIVQSKKDFRGKGGENFYEKISSENKKLLILENSGHLPFIDYDKELLFKEIEDFYD